MKIKRSFFTNRFFLTFGAIALLTLVWNVYIEFNDDGIIDGLFSFTRPITGSYFWCPPVTDGKINLSAVLNT